MGAYAHACKHIPSFSSIPVYSTFPVSNLGRLLLQDLYLSTPIASTSLLETPSSPPAPVDSSAPAILPASISGELPEGALKLPPTSAEIDSYCTRIVTLKYSQPTPLHSAAARVSGKLGSITITAYSAGHTLGGTIWKIQQAQESIVYAVDWNHSRENCLRAAAFLSGGGVPVETLGRPTALVCSAKNSEVVNIAGGRKKRDEMLLEAIKRTALEKGGTVLIPTDSVGRVLELVYLLEHAWRKDSELSSRAKGKGVGLYLAGRRVKRLGQVVGSMLEWMDEGVVREFEAIAGGEKRGNRGGNDGGGGGKGNDGNKAGPFDFTHMNLVSTQGHLSRILNDGSERGKVIIASDSSLGWGFSREALMRLASDEKNLVVLTERGDGKIGWAGSLWDEWKAFTSHTADEKLPTPGQEIPMNGKSTTLEIAHRIPLTGTELTTYNQHLAAAATTTHPASGLPPLADSPSDDSASDDSDSDSDSERQGKALTTKPSTAAVLHGGATPSGDIGVNVLLRGNNTYDYDVRGAKGRNRMFPFVMRRRRIDEYGEVIRTEEYMRAEEKAEEDLQDEADAAEERVIGKKRKWDEGRVAADPGKKRRVGRSKKGKTETDDGYEPDDGEEGDGEDAEDEDGEDEEVALALPSKVTFTSVEIQMRVRVAFIDFAGLHDSRSLRMLLPLIKPRKLILVAGREAETRSLASDCRALLSGRGIVGRGDSTTGTDVYMPQIGIKVNASVDTNAWTVKLSENLVRGLKWQNVRGLGVVHVVGRVMRAEDNKGGNVDAEERGMKKLKIEPHEEGEGERKKDNLVLDILPPALAAATRSVAQPIHVGDIRLADLRRVLLDDGLTAEFRGEGTLLIDGVVAVRKGGVGNVIIEDGGGGMLRRGKGGKGSFVEVRRRVYDGLAVVAGG